MHEGGTRLEELHATPVDGVPGAMTPFKGRLLVGVDNTVRVYECGKRKLLRKSEYRGCVGMLHDRHAYTQHHFQPRRVPNHVTTIGTMGRRVYAGDLQEGFFFLRHKKADNKLYPFAEVVGSRYVTAGLVLDYDTVAGADKFGNFFINRLPADVSAEVRCGVAAV